MLVLKKTTMACFVLGSNMIFAGSMGDVCNENATIPCKHIGWDVGAKALYLEPIIGAANIHGLSSNSSQGNKYVNFDPNYAWGFALEASYLFNTGNDLNINWSRVTETTTRTIGPNRTVENAVLSQDSVSINPIWNAVNFEVGQHINFGDMKLIRFHGGVEYAQIGTDWSATGAFVSSPTVINHVYTKRDFNGFGPRLGADLSYNWNSGLGVYANTATALLVGKQGSTSFAPIESYGSSTTVVPELEAKLGVKYTYPSQFGALTLDAGWMWINYFDAVLYNSSSIETLQPMLFTSNFALQGVFFGFKWSGNIA